MPKPLPKPARSVASHCKSALRTAGITAALSTLTIIGWSVSPVLAGSCPEDQVLSEPRDLETVQGRGVSAEILGQIDLTGWREVGNLRLRMREIVIQPGGVVATHDHADRPAIVIVLDGDLIEHNAFCAEPIIHRAGETATEVGAGHRHWWENPTDAPVTVYSADIVAFEAPATNSDM